MAQVCMTKLIFLYSGKLQRPRGIRMVSKNFEKNFLTFLGLGTNVVKVSSVNSELLFQWDTLMQALYTGGVKSVSKKGVVLKGGSI